MVCGPLGPTNLITVMPDISGFDENKQQTFIKQLLRASY